MNLSLSEENYVKHIFHLSVPGSLVSTTALAQSVKAKASSVTDMLDKLYRKKIISYEKYKGVALTPNGRKNAIEIVRKHRLWEVFLVSKLGFTWDKVHEIAEELEHIKSTELIDKLDEFLGQPKFDPHGDPIPDKNGQFAGTVNSIAMNKGKLNVVYSIQNVLEDDKTFLAFLTQLELTLHAPLVIKQKFDYNSSIEIELLQSKKNIVLDEPTQKKIMLYKKRK